MSDQSITSEQAWPDRELTQAQRDNRQSAALIPVARSGVVPMNFAQMVDYARFMSTAKGAVGAHLMGNVGACLAVMEIANQFGLPAYAIARQSYLVNGRVAFMGQFFHTVVEDFAPLKKGANGRKLQFRYEGEAADGTLKIFVSATFEGATVPVEYESPMIKDLKVKNSPLWITEPKRQFIFFGVRGWQTIHWPEGLLHAISEEEAASLPPSEYARDVTPIGGPAATPESVALRERLEKANAAHPTGEPRAGFTDGFTEAHFTELPESDGDAVKMAAAINQPEPAKTEAPADPKPKAGAKAKPDKKTKASGDFPGDTKMPAQDPAKVELPKTAAEWAPWARAWLAAEKSGAAMRSRWGKEQKLRNDIGVTSEERDPVFAYYQDRLTEVETMAQGE